MKVQSVYHFYNERYGNVEKRRDADDLYFVALEEAQSFLEHVHSGIVDFERLVKEFAGSDSELNRRSDKCWSWRNPTTYI